MSFSTARQNVPPVLRSSGAPRLASGLQRTATAEGGLPPAAPAGAEGADEKGGTGEFSPAPSPALPLPPATRAEASLDRFFNLSVDLLCVAGFDGYLKRTNPSWERGLGFAAEELQAIPILDLVHPDDRDDTARHLSRLASARQPVLFESRFRRRDGSHLWLQWNAMPLPEQRLIYASARDITDRRRVEQEMQKLAAQLLEQAALLDKAQDAILVRDLEHRIIYWNKSAERIFGWTAAEVVGKNSLELISRQQGAEFMEALQTVLSNGEWSGEVRQGTKSGGEVMVESRWTLVRDADGHPKSILVLSTDITERKKLEAQFLRAQRLESIGTLASGIAHDLNNILAPIMMSVKLLQETITNATFLLKPFTTEKLLATVNEVLHPPKLLAP